MWCRCLDQLRLQPSEDMEARAQRIKRQWSILYPSGRPFLLEKSVANAVRTDFLQTYFAPAYFIYLVRNGYAVAEGIRRKANPAKYGIRPIHRVTRLRFVPNSGALRIAF